VAMATPLISFLTSDLPRITRFWNLLIIGLCQYFTVCFLIHPELLLDWKVFVLTASTASIAAAGYIINDYYDVKIDLINKPERVVIGKTLTRRSAILLHSFLSFTGVALGFLLDWKIGVVNFFSSFLLWLYSNSLKRLPLVGNVAVSLLTGLSVAIVIFLYPDFSVTSILVYSLFAFFMTLVREIIKDMEDLKGDNTFGCKTLPIVWGIRKTKVFIYVLTALFIANLFIIHFYVEPLPLKFFLVFLFAPITLLIAWLVRADTKKDFYRLSALCKIIMLFGILSMAFL
jgi:4-hydroxybenzoate polyprenyltransferase